jgi:hypothetical protein
MMRPIAFTVISTVPAAPNPFTLQVTGSATILPSVNLTWTDPTPASSPTTIGNPANEIGFRIDRAVGNGAFNPLFTAPANSTTYSDNAVGSGTTYRYRVVAFNAAGQTSSTTQSATIPNGNWPITPTGFSGLVQSSAPSVLQVLLSWNRNTVNTTGYYITRTGGTSTFTPVTVAGINSATYIDTTVVASTTYTYTLSALNGAVVSLPATLTLTVIVPPSAPSNLAATTITQTSVTLTWTNNAVPTATGLKIEMSQNSTTWNVVVTWPGSNTTYTVTGLTNHTTRPLPYYFRIRAYYFGAIVAYSNYTPVITVNTLP